MRRAVRTIRPIAVMLMSWAMAAACAPAVATPSPTSALHPTATARTSPTLPTPSPSPINGAAVQVDPTLLEIFPRAVDGLEIVESPAGEAAALADPLLPQVAMAVAAGLAIEPVSGDFVYGLIVRLIPDALDGAAYRDWRDAFDEGACSQAGGVAGHEETELGGRVVYSATCAGGLRTYHVWLESIDVLISASAVGERRLGERLVENLRP